MIWSGRPHAENTRTDDQGAATIPEAPERGGAETARAVGRSTRARWAVAEGAGHPGRDARAAGRPRMAHRPDLAVVRGTHPDALVPWRAVRPAARRPLGQDADAAGVRL